MKRGKMKHLAMADNIDNAHQKPIYYHKILQIITGSRSYCFNIFFASLIRLFLTARSDSIFWKIALCRLSPAPMV